MASRVETVGDVIDELVRYGWRVNPGDSQYDQTHDDWRLYKNGVPIFIQGVRKRRLSPTAVYNLLVEGGVIKDP